MNVDSAVRIAKAAHASPKLISALWEGTQSARFLPDGKVTIVDDNRGNSLQAQYNADGIFNAQVRGLRGWAALPEADAKALADVLAQFPRTEIQIVDGALSVADVQAILGGKNTYATPATPAISSAPSIGAVGPGERGVSRELVQALANVEANPLNGVTQEGRLHLSDNDRGPIWVEAQVSPLGLARIIARNDAGGGVTVPATPENQRAIIDAITTRNLPIKDETAGGWAAVVNQFGPPVEAPRYTTEDFLTQLTRSSALPKKFLQNAAAALDQSAANDTGESVIDYRFAVHAEAAEALLKTAVDSGFMAPARFDPKSELLAVRLHSEGDEMVLDIYAVDAGRGNDPIVGTPPRELGAAMTATDVLPDLDEKAGVKLLENAARLPIGGASDEQAYGIGGWTGFDNVHKLDLLYDQHHRN